jgi:hypothetical protein
METNWQVDLHIVLNGQYIFSQSDKEEISKGEDWSEGSYWFDQVQCEVAPPMNAYLSCFDTGMDSWCDDNSDYHSFEMTLTYKYVAFSAEDVIQRVMEDFQKTRFQFASTGPQVDIYIDRVTSWAFYDLQNPLSDDELEVEIENSDGYFPNFLFSDSDGAFGDVDLSVIPELWTLSDNLTPKPC